MAEDSIVGISVNSSLQKMGCLTMEPREQIYKGIIHTFLDVAANTRTEIKESKENQQNWNKMASIPHSSPGCCWETYLKQIYLPYCKASICWDFLFIYLFLIKFSWEVYGPVLPHTKLPSHILKEAEDKDVEYIPFILLLSHTVWNNLKFRQLPSTLFVVPQFRLHTYIPTHKRYFTTKKILYSPEA